MFLVNLSLALSSVLFLYFLYCFVVNCLYFRHRKVGRNRSIK